MKTAYVLTLFNKGINTLRIALKVAQDRSNMLHSCSVSFHLSPSEFFNKGSLNFVVLLTYQCLCDFEST